MSTSPSPNTAEIPAATRSARRRLAGAGSSTSRPSRVARVFTRHQPALPWHTILAASVAGALTIAILGLVGDATGFPILIAAFGSSCVLVFLLPDAPLSQPANVVGGHAVSALCGLAVHSLLPTAWWSLGLAVGLAMAAMAGGRVIHPPAGGTPIAIMLTHEGWGYLFTPVIAGAVVLTVCALTYRWLLDRIGTRHTARV